MRRSDLLARAWPVPVASWASILLFLAVLAPRAVAQVPTKCFEIESILVNACNGSCPGGGDEEDNEMVGFIVGPDPLDIDGFDITWPTAADSWDGFVQSATTAQRTADINASILGCGYVLEPPAGIIPPGKHVIAVTSTEMCPTGNSFAALMDTLYILYQQDGNTIGHFGNSGTGTRTLIMRYGGCSDTAVYEPALLVDENGVPANQDGGTVLLAWPGAPVPTYVNFGCQAPFVPLMPAIVSGGGAVACGGSTALVAEFTGAADSFFWTGGAGSFSDPASLTTTYTLGTGETGTFDLSFCAVSLCGDTVCDDVAVNVQGAVPADFTTLAEGVCAPVCVSFTATSAGTDFTWDFGDGEGGTGATAEHCFTDAGSFDITLTVDAGTGCPSTVSVPGLITVQEAVAAAIDASPLTGTAPLTVTFDNGTVPATATPAWDLGDGETSAEQEPVHVYAEPGTYMVVLTATATCTDRDTVYIVVIDPPVPPDTSWILVPNVVTPNGDRSNDGFRIVSNALSSLSVDIFNRWGQQVGDIRQVGGTWNGRNTGGEPVPAGTYFYVLVAQGLDGTAYERHGAFSVLR